MLILGALGVLGGFIQVAVFTWIQQRAAPHMLGRMMGLFMFIFMGVAPLTAAAAGWLASLVSLSSLFVGAGLGLSVAALGAWLFTPMAQLSDAVQPDTVVPAVSQAPTS
jgi:hypothetical protein